MLRSVGDDFGPKQFCTWAPKAIAMIGRMPPTLYSRSVHVEIERKTATEYAEPLRPDCLAALKPLGGRQRDGQKTISMPSDRQTRKFPRRCIAALPIIGCRYSPSPSRRRGVACSRLALLPSPSS